MKVRRSELVRTAQIFLNNAIEVFEVACEGDSNADAYMVAQLKILASSNHGYLSNDLNLDELAERYENTEEHTSIDASVEVDADWYNELDERI
jgi:hypothetical protein